MYSGKIMGSKARSKKVAERLAWYFDRSGYVRYQDAERLSREGCMVYKKGDELRLSARDAAELAEIRRLLELAGFHMGRAFMKNGRYCQPVYGRAAVRRFLDLIGVKKER